MKDYKCIQFSQLLDMDSPAAVLEEVKYNFIHYYPIKEFESVRVAFKDFNDLYEGHYPGYHRCNTKYHDKIHTTDALLAISRMIDGYNIKSKRKLPQKKVIIALIATIFHDTGYIQTTHDKKGTGAKYTKNHVDRSIEFIRKYFNKKGYSRKDFILAKNIVRCTGLFVNLSSISFCDKYEKLLGFMLGASDLLGQMASRTYLERLVYLYREFKEGNIKGYESEYDLLRKTLKFYETIKLRLNNDLKNVDNYALMHFKNRYGINKNLYHVAVYRHIEHLKHILRCGPKAYYKNLRRQGIVNVCGVRS